MNFNVFIFVVLLTASAVFAKPVQPESAESPAGRPMDSLSGFSMGSNKASRSVSSMDRSPLDSLGDANILRSLDTIGGNNYLRSLDSLGNGNYLRDLDSTSVAKLNRALDSLGTAYFLRQAPELPLLDYRTLDSLGGANLLRSIEAGGRPSNDLRHSGKRFDTLRGMTLGHQKRTFDEVDRTAFDGFNKRNFDEIDRVGFDGFTKRNVRSMGAAAS